MTEEADVELYNSSDEKVIEERVKHRIKIAKGRKVEFHYGHTYTTIPEHSGYDMYSILSIIYK